MTRIGESIRSERLRLALKRLRSTIGVDGASAPCASADLADLDSREVLEHRKVRGHSGDTIRCFLLLLERHPVRPRPCSLLELRLAIPLSRRKHGFKSRRGRQLSQQLGRGLVLSALR